MSKAKRMSNSTARSESWWRGVGGEEHIAKLESSNYDKFLSQADKPTFVMFYAQWCGYSVNAKRGFAAAAEQLAIEGIPVQFGAVDCDQCEDLRDRYREIAGYPTFLYFCKGFPVMAYNQSRTKDGFYSWISNKMEAAQTS